MVSEEALTIRAKILGVLLRDSRLAANKSAAQCAEVLGVSSRVYKAYENGTKSLSLPELELLAYFTDTPIPHYWGDEVISDDVQLEDFDTEQVLLLRRRLIGAHLRQARLDQDKTLKEIASAAGISSRRLSSYEMGDKPIPLPELELLSKALGMTIDDFAETSGPIAAWSRARYARQEVERMPADLQKFISDPLNRPYLELARQLAALPGQHMRELAENMLEITY